VVKEKEVACILSTLLLFLFFCLFNIFSISYSSSLSTSTSFGSSTLCLFTSSLYLITQLTFTNRWILIVVSSFSLTVLVDIISSIIYGPTYQSTSFFASYSLNTKILMLNIILSPLFHISTYFLSLSAYFFISSYTFFSATPAFP